MKKMKIIFGLLAAFSLVFISCDPAADSPDTSATATVKDTKTDDPKDVDPEDDDTEDTIDLKFPITIVSDGTILKEGVKLTFNEDKTCVAVDGTNSVNGTFTIRKSFVIAKVPAEADSEYYIAYQIKDENTLIPYTLDLSKAEIGWGEDVSISTEDGKLKITNTSDKWWQVAIPYNPDVAPAKAWIPLSNDSTDSFRIGLTTEKWGEADNEKAYSLYSDDQFIDLDSEHSYVVIKGNGNKVSVIDSIIVSWYGVDYSNAADKDIFVSTKEQGDIVESKDWVTALILDNKYDLSGYKYLNIETYIEGDVIENSNVTLKCLDYWGPGGIEVGIVSEDNSDFARTPTTYQTKFGSDSTNIISVIQIFALDKKDWSVIPGVKVHILKVTATNKKIEQE